MRKTMEAMLIILIFFGGSKDIEATYSIVATDKGTKQIGGSGASCVEFSVYDAMYNSVPGMGAFHTQAHISEIDPVRELGKELIQNGTDPLEIINKITQEAVDGYMFANLTGPTLRQYGIVDLQNRSAGYTGSNIEFVYENYYLVYGTDQSDRQGNIGNFTYSVQGNIVTKQTVPNAESAFLNNSGCDLADRLMRALLAGGLNGEGDFRCRSEDSDTSSKAAFLHVDNSDGTTFVHIDVIQVGEEEPLLKLKSLYDVWRNESEPCADYIPLEVPLSNTGSISSFYYSIWCLIVLVMILV